MNKLTIAIDGPAGSGKSTIAGAVAKRLGILHLDTGAMYRAIALFALRNKVNIADHAAVAAMLGGVEISVEYGEDAKQRTLINGEDVSELIRTNEVSKAASDIAVIPEVRMKLVKTQRELSQKLDMVLDGRDTGSYVIPDAAYKFYLTASSSVRAKRRLLELNERGADIGKSIEEMQMEIEARDYTDMHREFAPLTRVADAIYIDTSDMSISEVENAVIQEIRGKNAL